MNGEIMQTIKLNNLSNGVKITANQYAKLLYESAKGKSQADIDNIIANFIKMLAKNNHLKLAKKIVEKFSEIYNRENGIVEAEITSREVLSNMLSNKAESFVKEKYNAQKVVLKNIVDEKIKGGIILKVGDELMDRSILGQLEDLKIKLSH